MRLFWCVFEWDGERRALHVLTHSVPTRRSSDLVVWTLLVNFAKDKISTALPELWLYALGLLFIIAVTALPRGIVGEFDGEPRFRPGKLGDMFARWRAGRASA